MSTVEAGHIGAPDAVRLMLGDLHPCYREPQPNLTAQGIRGGRRNRAPAAGANVPLGKKAPFLTRLTRPPAADIFDAY